MQVKKTSQKHPRYHMDNNIDQHAAKVLLTMGLKQYKQIRHFKQELSN
jgi:hypothetical protein